MKNNTIRMSLVVSGLILSASVLAGTVTIPNTFSSGDAAVAQEVNDNFSAVKAAVDDNDSSISTNTSNIGTNTSNIGANTSTNLLWR